MHRWIVNRWIVCRVLSSNSIWYKAFPITMDKSKCCTDSQKKKEKKEKWQTCVKNYLPISLLQICNEVLNHVIYNAMFSYFLKNNLISEIQSGFKPSHSCINQLLSISQSLFSSFDENCQVRGNSLTFVARWNYS